MTDETVTTQEPAPAGEPQVIHHTTVVRERSGSGMGVVLAIILLVAVIAGIYIFNQQSASEVAKNNAVTEAANKVGNAASDVGDAAKDAAKDAAGQ